MVTPVLEVQGSRLVMLSFHSFFLTFLEIFPSMNFSLSIVAVLVSVRHLEVGVKNSPRSGLVWSRDNHILVITNKINVEEALKVDFCFYSVERKRFQFH